MGTTTHMAVISVAPSPTSHGKCCCLGTWSRCVTDKTQMVTAVKYDSRYSGQRGAPGSLTCASTPITIGNSRTAVSDTAAAISRRATPECHMVTKST